MLAGYNTNISYRDKVYHIQTEDSGQGNPVIVTLLYSKGAILASKKTSYEQIITAPDFKDQVRKMMKAQHKFMIKELLAGKYTAPPGEETVGLAGGGEAEKAAEAEGVSAAGKAGEAQEVSASEKVADAVPQETDESSRPKKQTGNQMTNSLDDVLLNFILKRKKE